MEAGIVAAFAYWGAHTSSSPWLEILAGITAPLVGFGVWGAIDFHQARKHAESLRLIEELVISLLAAAALYTAGQHVAGAALGALSIAYHVLVYATGATLLEREHRARATPT